MKLSLPAFFVIVGSAVFLRWMPHPPNFSPIPALALFGGAYFSKKWLALMVPLTAMFLGDLLWGFHLWITPVVYLSIAFMVGTGVWLKKSRKPSRIIAAGLLNSVQFFIVTNMAVWAFGGTYSKSINGFARNSKVE